MKVLIAIPCMDTLDTMFVHSLLDLHKPCETQISFSSSSLVYDSRNKLALEAVETNADYVMWLDSDMVFKPDILERMLKSIEGKDFVTGLAFARRMPFTPCIYKKIRMGFGNEFESEQYLDYPTDSLFEIDACGFACCLVRTSVFADLIESGDARIFSPMNPFGEDISACIRMKKKGYKLWCDSSIKIGHVARTVVSEQSYQQYKQYVERLEDDRP